MKLTILRSFLITACLLLAIQGLQAQYRRGHSNYRHYNNRYDHYYRSRVSIGFSSPGYYNYPGRYRSYGSYGSYGFYGSYSRPHIGIHVNILPRGYSRFYLGSSPYYYYGGSYYRPGPRPDDYEVIDAPLGASVPELPESAQVVVINDQKYYELGGTYYKEEIRENNEIWYTIVGKNGKLNTDDLPMEDEGPVVGDIVDKLPGDCHKVILNGTTYYVSPDNVYYEETIQQNTIRYKVSGK